LSSSLADDRRSRKKNFSLTGGTKIGFRFLFYTSTKLLRKWREEKKSRLSQFLEGALKKKVTAVYIRTKHVVGFGAARQNFERIQKNAMAFFSISFFF
jgi:UTP-glucose-1-phosphate uridylyltransferase